MNRYIIILGICSLFVLSLAMFSCVKPCLEADHDFSVSESFLPEKDSIRIGDSLFITCIIPKIEKDRYTQVIINFSGANNIGDHLVISDISKFNTQRDASDSFSYFKIQGNIYSDQYGVKQLSFAEIDTAYQLQVGLIAQKRGLYIFTIPDMPGVYRNGQAKCGRGNFQILNANVNKHLYLFENLWGPIISPYDAAHSYCVKVK